jgi:glycosyltransferase involved in cell wall biosynthesis
MLFSPEIILEIDTIQTPQAWAGLFARAEHLPRILFLTHRFPYPPIGGDRVKAYHLLRHLSRYAAVDVISLDEADTATLLTLGLENIRSMRTVAFNKASAALRIVGSLVTSRPIEFAYYHAPEMQSAVDEALAKNTYDLIICFFLRTAEYVTSWTKTPKLLIAEDARIILQERASKHFEFSPQYFVRKIDAKKLKAFEPKIMSHGFDLVTFVAREDESRILEANHSIRTAILSNGIDLNEFGYSTAPRAMEVVFAGHLGVYHNILMATRLLKRIFPLIKKALPEVTLVIVGKDPNAKLKALIESTEGARLYANVPDVKPYLARAKVFVHPQEVGAGIQNKLLEAMGVGTPVVTSAIGAAGIAGIVNEENALVRNSDEAFANAAIELLQDDRRGSALAINARALVESRYSWQHVFEKLDRIVQDLTGKQANAKA